MHTIEIDFEVYKAITIRRETEEVTPNDVLRELLGLKPKKDMDYSEPSTGRPWVSKGVEFPHGTEFRATHKGILYQAVVEDGALALKGERFSSPSSAAVSITKNSINGWIFWECKFPGTSSWRLIKDLRK